MNEILYHPLKYKTSVCFNLKKDCKIFECPHYQEDRKHQERRDINQINNDQRVPHQGCQMPQGTRGQQQIMQHMTMQANFPEMLPEAN